MTGAERFDNFMREYFRVRLERRRKELQARHDEGPDEYLSPKPASLPLPRFRVRAGDGVTAPAELRRRHRRTNKRPTGRPLNGEDVLLGPKVVDFMRTEGLTETAAIARVTDKLGLFDGWDDPTNTRRDARKAARNSARDRVYRSRKRYLEYLPGDSNFARFEDANAGWSMTPEAAGRRAYEIIRAKRLSSS